MRCVALATFLGKSKRRSLRSQIVFWYALIIPLLMLTMVLVAQRVLTLNLRSALDHRLEGYAEVIAEYIEANPAGSPEEYTVLLNWLTEEQLPYIPTLLRISNPKGEELATLGKVPSNITPLMDQALLSAKVDDGRFQTIEIRGQEALRLYTFPVVDPSTGKTLVLIQTADSLAQVVTAEQHLWQYTIAVGIVGSVAAVLVGWRIIGRGLRPLDSIFSQLEEVASKNLTVRISEEQRPVELQRLADSLNDMLSRLDEAFKAREAFVAGVSHDLRTPLTVLQGQVDVLLMEPAIASEVKDSLRRMAKEIRRLVRLSNNLVLDVQLQLRPTLVREEVNLAELASEVAREAEVLAEGLDICISTPKAIVVPGDYDLLKEMLLNVVDNAVKFTPKGGTVDLSLKLGDSYAIITVSDTGCGIPANDLAQLTQPFRRTRSAVKPVRRGTGLGLTIAKQIAELHGGSIEIQSKVGVGTTVTLLLPRSPD
jgi:signal transduction histidine kinase